VVTAVFPLIDAGVLQPSFHTEAFERRMNSVAQERLQARREAGLHGQSDRGRDTVEPETIVSQAETVGRILNDYIAIHDDIFGGGFLRNLRRMIPIPGIFQPIDFDRHDRDVGALAQELEAVKDRIGVDDPPAQLADLLARYCHALMNALRQLERISRKLGARKDDRSSYKDREYNADLTDYEEAIVAYRSMGEHVNRAFRAPFA
jgi:hypothetical protein